MEDFLQPLLVILTGGLFAPLITQLIERFIGNPSASVDNERSQSNLSAGDRRKKWIKLFSYAVVIQLTLFTIFFLCSKWMYFDKNYFDTTERQLIREGLKKEKSYIIPKMTIRIYSESPKGMALPDSLCNGKRIKYCTPVTISYEIVALRDFNNEKLFSEYFEALYAVKVVNEPGSEIEGRDRNPTDNVCWYDITTSMKKFERKTIITRADYLYSDLPSSRKFFDDTFNGLNWDMFYYPNKEDDVIGEVEYQIISRTLRFKTPELQDAIFEDAFHKHIPITPKLIVSQEDCVNYNILTARIPKLQNSESFGIKWQWQ